MSFDIVKCLYKQNYANKHQYQKKEKDFYFRYGNEWPIFFSIGDQNAEKQAKIWRLKLEITIYCYYHTLNKNMQMNAC